MKFRIVPFREYAWMAALGLANIAEGLITLVTVGHIHTGFPLVVARQLSKSRMRGGHG